MTLSACHFGPARSDAERDAYIRALTLAFASKPEGVGPWLDRAGHENFRLLTAPSGEVLGGMLFTPAGQFFGGRSVPMWGVAGVAVPPEARGRGAAKEIMRRAMRELRERGVALSALYPATQWLYRTAGYEQGGVLYDTKINPKLIRAARTTGEPDAPMTARAFIPADDAGVRAMYTRISRDADGRLDRGEDVWNTVMNPHDAKAHGFVFEAAGGSGGASEGASGDASGGGGLEGYLFLSQKRSDTGKHDATVTDVAFTTARAGRRILAFLADLRSMCDTVLLRSGPGDPLLMLMAEHPYQIRIRESWMLRIADAPGALGARGYAPGLTASLTITLRDESMPEASGSWLLRVADGRAEARPAPPGGTNPGRTGGAGAAPAIDLTERALAALYTGYLSAHALRDAGLLRADDESCDAASAIFAPSRSRCGTAPSMVDFF